MNSKGNTESKSSLVKTIWNDIRDYYQNIDERTKTLWMIALLSFLVHLFLAAVTLGHSTDTYCFLSWGERMRELGPSGFYEEGVFADYTPAYMLVLWLTSSISHAMNLMVGYAGYKTVMVLFPSLADAATVLLIGELCRRKKLPFVQTQKIATLMALNPIMLLDNSVWKQIDGFFTFPLLLCFLYLDEERYILSAFWFGVALAIKPQAFLAGPVFGLCFVLFLVKAYLGKTANTEEGAKPGTESGAVEALKALGVVAVSVVAAVLPPILTGIPFFGIQKVVPSLIEKYMTTSSSYPYGSVNACNFIAALGGNWQDSKSPIFLGLSWNNIGTIFIALITAYVIAIAVVCVKQKKEISWTTLGAIYILAIFVFGQNMHERYLYPGVILLYLAAVLIREKRVYQAAQGFMICGFLNIYITYIYNGSDFMYLNNTLGKVYLFIGGWAITALCVYTMYVVWDVLVRGNREDLRIEISRKAGEKKSGKSQMDMEKKTKAQKSEKTPNEQRIRNQEKEETAHQESE